MGTEILPRLENRTSSPGLRLPIDGDNEIVWNDDPRFAHLPDTPEPVPCDFCGKLRFTKGTTCAGIGRVFWINEPEACDCPQAQAAEEQRKAEEADREDEARRAKEQRELREKVSRLVGQSGMGNRFLQRTFETFQLTPDNQKAFMVAKRYADNFDKLLPEKGGADPGKNGLFIAGRPGTGKTHLAAAISNQLINRGISVVCMTSIDLLNRIRKSYSAHGAEDEDAVLGIFKRVSLLVLDDLGKEKATDWAIATLYNIVNARYETYLPIIVTTNYGAEALVERLTPAGSGDNITASATIDRLIEVCKGVSLDCPSWRRR